MILVPGYRELFGEPNATYEELVQSMPSRVIIEIAVALNNELNAPISEKHNQKRLRDLVSQRFTQQQNNCLNAAYGVFRKKNGQYNDDVFGRRYLLTLILKELNTYRDIPGYQDIPQHEHDFLMAYLLVIDEVNAKDNELLKEAKQHQDDLRDYRLIWTPNITQYEFNEDSNIRFEMLKLLMFVKYCFDNYRDYLREYISSFAFPNLSQFIGSIHQLSMTTLNYNEAEAFTKLSWIHIDKGVSPLHLDGWSINKSIGGDLIFIDNIRRFPIFKSENRYLIIDETIFNKKHYKGPFFELFRNTKLKNKISFETYCSTIASEVLEKQLFRGLLNELQIGKYDILHFDEGEDGMPDAYYRRNKSIILFEFKAYLFPAHLSDNPNFENIKKYIHHRFIANEEGKAKGINQFKNQLQKLKAKAFKFDPYYNTHLSQKKVDVYPVIVHSEFNLTLPGIGDYLNREFRRNLPIDFHNSYNIKEVQFVSLQTIFEYVNHKSSFQGLISIFDRFSRVKKSRKEFFEKNKEINSFIRSYAGFDEIYNCIFAGDLKPLQDIPKLQKIAKITQQELDIHL